MNIINTMVSHLQFKIPNEILQEAFKDDTYQYHTAPLSLTERIMNKVIRPRVMVDMNLVGGIISLISLEGLQPGWLPDNYTQIYRIPPDRTNHRQIMSVLSVSYLPFYTSYNAMGVGSGTINPLTMTDVPIALQRVMDSHSNIPVVSNASVELIGPDTVAIRDQLRVYGAYHLKCLLGYDEALTNINPRSYPEFFTLCELAVKSYIYNKLYIRLDQAYMVGGMELGAFKSYIDDLRDAEEMYMTHLNEVWRKVGFMNDKYGYTNFLKIMINPSI